MDGMDHVFAQDNVRTAVPKWQKLLAHTSTTTSDPDELAAAAQRLASLHPLPPVAMAEILLQPTPTHRQSYHPRTRQIADVFLRRRILEPASVLKTLYKHSTLHTMAEKDGGRVAEKQTLRWKRSCTTDEYMFRRMVKHLSQGSDGRNTAWLLRAVAAWMVLFADVEAAFARDAYGVVHSPSDKEDVGDAREALLELVLVILQRCGVSWTGLHREEHGHLRKELAHALAVFAPTIPDEPAARLHLFRTQTLAEFEPVEKAKDAADDAHVDHYAGLVDLESFSVPEVTQVNSRAGLYIYLNATLVGRPLVEDGAFHTYLRNRYQSNLQACAIDLILASFDVVANAVFRNEGSRNGHLLRSFLVNKVPLVLKSLSASAVLPMYPFDPQACITQALDHVDTNIFPTFSGMFDMTNTNSSFHDSVRQDFCFACQLHGMLTEPAIEKLLGDITYQSLPDEGLLTEDALVKQCLHDQERTHRLVGDVEKMDGNVGAAARALVEVLGRLCRDKDTVTLKSLCSQLAAKPLSLDILLLFDKPAKILHPLCELLDGWRYEEDQGEYQPVYDQFGSILLLLFAFKYRYNLTPADLGIRSPDSFVASLLTGGCSSRSFDALTESESSQVGGWLKGLFSTDTGGLGDELMSSCPPQDFYLLVPTLLDQIVLAVASGVLGGDVLKSGLEYSVEPFLLPSLVPGLLFLADRLAVEPAAEHKAIIQILQLVMLPGSLSHEASAMLSAVLNMVAKPMERALRMYQNLEPKSPDIEPLLGALKENIALSGRTGEADMNELESWATSQGGLLSGVRHIMHSLVQWCQQQTLNSMATTYTHRHVIAAINIHGARDVLHVIVDELKNQTAAGNVGEALDVAKALVCAPNVTNDAPVLPADDAAAAVLPTHPALQRRMTLREALKIEAEGCKLLQKRDPSLAETVVRLYRRVEEQMLPLPPEPPQDMLAARADPALDDALNAAVAASANGGADGLALNTADLDAVTGDLGLVSAGVGDLVSGGLELGGDDFLGLGGSGDFNAGFDWGDMDLTL